MTEEQQKKELEIALTSYIALKHTQEECIGFIDGFKEALSLFAVRQSLPSDVYTEIDIDKAYKCGERQSTFYKKNGTVILPRNYEGVDG